MKILFVLLLNILYAESYCEDFCLNNNCSELNGNFFSECAECGPQYSCNLGLKQKEKNYQSYFNVSYHI